MQVFSVLCGSVCVSGYSLLYLWMLFCCCSATYILLWGTQKSSELKKKKRCCSVLFCFFPKAEPKWKYWCFPLCWRVSTIICIGFFFALLISQMVPCFSRLERRQTLVKIVCVFIWFQSKCRYCRWHHNISLFRFCMFIYMKQHYLVFHCHPIWEKDLIITLRAFSH